MAAGSLDFGGGSNRRRWSFRLAAGVLAVVGVVVVLAVLGSQVGPAVKSGLRLPLSSEVGHLLAERDEGVSSS